MRICVWQPLPICLSPAALSISVYLSVYVSVNHYLSVYPLQHYLFIFPFAILSIHLSFPLHRYLSVYPPLAALFISVSMFASLFIHLSIPLHHLLFICPSPCSTTYPPIHPCSITYPSIHISNTSVWFKRGGWLQQKTLHLLIQNAPPLGTSFAPSLLSYAFLVP